MYIKKSVHNNITIIISKDVELGEMFNEEYNIIKYNPDKKISYRNRHYLLVDLYNLTNEFIKLLDET